MKSEESIKDKCENCKIKKELELAQKLVEKSLEAYGELLREQYGF